MHASASLEHKFHLFSSPSKRDPTYLVHPERSYLLKFHPLSKQHTSCGSNVPELRRIVQIPTTADSNLRAVVLREPEELGGTDQSVRRLLPKPENLSLIPALTYKTEDSSICNPSMGSLGPVASEPRRIYLKFTYVT